MPRIFDSPADFADDALDGFVAANRGYVAMVDALLPFRVAFLTEFDAGAPVDRALAAAAAAAGSAAVETARLRPLKGRARPLAEKSVGHPDPGAVSFGLITARISQHIDSRLRGSQAVPAGNGVQA
ncbi:DAK2 domain-containing protein [Arthrobacter sp. MI7-26]|uniref:DAK2 domain-containing protein n=1 Tax=Arthrobacter sp. MI7-26 TaxID=2993653 RepID=UPI0022490C8F|nr:DAK2 domain-containing protein [Arthrobacter sp. MI7-26]MCX2750077.1 DAK2 domain-containing protein [Arthrobacter sp. MI7-26]